MQRDNPLHSPHPPQKKYAFYCTRCGKQANRSSSSSLARTEIPHASTAHRTWRDRLWRNESSPIFSSHTLISRSPTTAVYTRLSRPLSLKPRTKRAEHRRYCPCWCYLNCTNSFRSYRGLSKPRQRSLLAVEELYILVFSAVASSFVLLHLGIDGKVHLLAGHPLVKALHVGRSRLEVASKKKEKVMRDARGTGVINLGS